MGLWCAAPEGRWGLAVGDCQNRDLRDLGIFRIGGRLPVGVALHRLGDGPGQLRYLLFQHIPVASSCAATIGGSVGRRRLFSWVCMAMSWRRRDTRVHSWRSSASGSGRSGGFRAAPKWASVCASSWSVLAGRPLARAELPNLPRIDHHYREAGGAQLRYQRGFQASGGCYDYPVGLQLGQLPGQLAQGFGGVPKPGLPCLAIRGQAVASAPGNCSGLPRDAARRPR